MKNAKSLLSILFLAVTLTLSAQTTKKVNTTTSTIKWIGKKVTGQHDGTINLSEGTLLFKNEKLVGGNFKVDMTSINTTDLEGGAKAKLDGHLKADDFFGTEKHPTATLVFKKIATKKDGNYTIYADLTIKGITNEVVFDMNVNMNVATAKVVIDRTKYDIKYGSGSFFDGLGDKTISDEFELNVTLNLE